MVETKALIRFVLGLSSSVLLLSCESSPLEPISDTVLIEGQITQLGHDVGRSGQFALLVEADPSKQTTTYARIVAHITQNTDIRFSNSSAATFRDLAVGMKVRIWNRGAVIDTDPALAEAGRVEILSE